MEEGADRADDCTPEKEYQYEELETLKYERKDLVTRNEQVVLYYPLRVGNCLKPCVPGTGGC